MSSSWRKSLVLSALLVLVVVLALERAEGTQLSLNLLDSKKYPLALCNDGTSSGYYYLPATTKPDRWIFHLEGGWWCWDDKTCLGRTKGSKPMVSSAFWPSMRNFGGIFSNDASVNEDWTGVHFVFMPYCSSDAWVGDGVGLVNNTEWQFRGRRVVEAVFRTFFTGRSLTRPQEVLFSGCSAGGQGLIYNLDYVADLLHQLIPTPLRIKGLADAGWMMDLPSSRNPNSQVNKQFSDGWKLWSPRYDKHGAFTACFITNPTNPSHCLFTPTALPFMKTPTLIQSSAYDAFQVPYDCCSPPFTDPSVRHNASMMAKAAHTSMHALIHPPHNVFSSSCFTHCLTESSSFTSQLITSTSLSSLLSNWFFDRTPAMGPLIDDCGFNCSTKC